MRPQDVLINLVEDTREDWSFGNGEAQYLVLPKKEWIRIVFYNKTSIFIC
jgi:4-oxalocrotonate tautomerase